MGLNLFFERKTNPMATSEKQGIPAVKKKGPVFVNEACSSCAVGWVVEIYWHFSRSRNSKNLRCYYFSEVSWPCSLAILFCVVDASLAWPGPLGAKTKPQLFENFFLVSRRRQTSSISLVVLVVKLQLSSLHHTFQFYVLNLPSAFLSFKILLHPFNHSPVVVCFLFSCAKGELKKKKLQSEIFFKMHRKRANSKEFVREGRQTQPWGEKTQGSVPILYMYNKLRCF